jgi:regulator of replication initiation timing
MADNIIKRIIQMVLDKDSAKKTQDDANAVAEGIDKAWKSMAAKVAGYLGAAFIADKIIGIGKESIKQASESDAAWKALKNTIDNTGGSFDALESKLRATADAFQDATIHDDDAFAKELSHVISLTDDVSASLNNMGLVADVAAKFFGGDLASAGTMVAKVMNGNITALNKMGIHVKSAQEGLEVLAKRSFGAAAEEASTFDGQLKQMDNTWNDILKDLGHAIIQSDGATDAFSVLRGALEVLGNWVQANQKDISRWVTNGIKFAIDAADVFIRAVTGMAQILTGGFMSAIGLATVGLGKLVEGWATLREIEDNIREKLGQDVTKRREATKAIRDNAEALIEWGKTKFNSGVDKIGSGIDRLSTRLFSSDQFANIPGRAPSKVPGEGNKPMTGKNVVTDASEEVRKAIEQFNKDSLAAANMTKILGDRFDSTGAEIDRTTKLLNVLAANGLTPASQGLGDLGGRLADLVDHQKPLADVTKELTKQLGDETHEGELAALAAAKHSDSLTQLQERQDALLNGIKTLLDAGFKPTDDAIIHLVKQYQNLTDAVAEITPIQQAAQVYRELGDEMRSNLFMATLDGVSALEKMKLEQNSLRAAIQKTREEHREQSKEMKDLVARYKDVTAAIKEQTTVMQLQAAAADFLADALGTAMQGGLHEAAAQKAKQNAIESVEMLVRAGAFALFGDFPQASAALVLAGQFAGLAVAWGALAAGTHGSSGSGGSGTSIPSSSGSSGAGSDLGSSRASSNDAASRSQQPSAEVSIYLLGPGFHAMNPAVQRVVWGAQQEAEERYGPNARIRVRSSETGG